MPAYRAGAIRDIVSLGPAQNTFGDSTTADKAAAEALRDAYETANAAWLALYNGNHAFLILLLWTGGASCTSGATLPGPHGKT